MSLVALIANYMYDRACEQEKMIKTILQQTGDSGLISYLDVFINEEGCSIYISVKEEAADALTDEVRDALKELGLTELADLTSGDSYIAVIQNGSVLTEESSHDTSPLEVYTNEYKLVGGPISKYGKLLKQMNNLPHFDYQRVCFGLQRMLWGYIQKMVIADRLALYTAAVFDAPATIIF